MDGLLTTENSYFIWSVRGVRIEKEEAYNCTSRDLEQYKLRLAAKHGCNFSDVTMAYQIGEGTKT
jgi:hypothetical protein